MRTDYGVVADKLERIGKILQAQRDLMGAEADGLSIEQAYWIYFQTLIANKAMNRVRLILDPLSS
jgi:hypothetical protein